MEHCNCRHKSFGEQWQSTHFRPRGGGGGRGEHYLWSWLDRCSQHAAKKMIACLPPQVKTLQAVQMPVPHPHLVQSEAKGRSTIPPLPAMTCEHRACIDSQ